MPWFYFDSTIIILIPAIVFAAVAQFKVNSAYKKYKKIKNVNGYTGEMVARKILDSSGLEYVPIEMINTRLGDHYDPRGKVLRLSPEVYRGTSIASAGIAAHETGHAIQHKESYAPLKIRGMMVPTVNMASNFSWILLDRKSVV